MQESQPVRGSQRQVDAFLPSEVAPPPQTIIAFSVRAAAHHVGDGALAVELGDDEPFVVGHGAVPHEEDDVGVPYVA